MAIFNLGSINIDKFFHLPTLPAPGETISASSLRTDLGGKGANQTVAAARAGARVYHIGMINRADAAMVDILRQAGADVTHVHMTDEPSGQANIYLDAAGENTIVLLGGANLMLTEAAVAAALETAQAGDWLILQNETNLVAFAARHAREKGLHVAYSAAPFDAQAVREVLPYVTLLAVNEVEHRQLLDSLPEAADQVAGLDLIVTKGEKGADFRRPSGTLHQPAFPVEVQDTTGAGDTFLGYFVAALDLGLDPATALLRAAAAGALQASRRGTASVIPDSAEVDAFIATRDKT